MKNANKAGIFLLSPITIWLYYWGKTTVDGGRGGLVDQVDQILGGYFQKTTQMHSEMVLSTAKRTFQISKLQNYMSHVNETCSRYVPHQHLSSTQKSGWQWIGG